MNNQQEEYNPFWLPVVDYMIEFLTTVFVQAGYMEDGIVDSSDEEGIYLNLSI